MFLLMNFKKILKIYSFHVNPVKYYLTSNGSDANYEKN